MSRTVGVFNRAPDSGPVMKLLQLEFSALDLITEWHRVGMTSDYVGGYLGYQFAERREAEEILSTVANELLENAAKFSEPSTGMITFDAMQIGDKLRFEVCNSASAVSADHFAGVLEESLREDPEALFVKRLTDGHADREKRSPGVGLVILCKDYGAELAARIDSEPNTELARIAVRATFNLEKGPVHG